MDIKQENIDALNALVKIKITPEDYKPGYDKKIAQYGQQVQMPGFRPGKVPTGVVKKKYGQSILAEEVNELLNEALYKHITDNKLDVLGNPLPVENKEAVYDFKSFDEFEFTYEIGLAPTFDLKIDKKDKVKYYKVKIDDKLISKQIEDYGKRYGALKDTDVAEDEDMILGDFVELNSDGSIKEGGITHKSTVSIPFLDDKKSKKLLVGLKKGDVVTLDPNKVSKGDADMAAMLNIKKEDVATVSDKFSFTVDTVKRLYPAAIDQALFDKIYGPEAVKSEEEFKSRITEDLQKTFVRDSEYLFRKSVSGQFLKKFKLSLPDDFLKRWIKATNEKEITDEQLAQDYERYTDDLKWQLVENKVIKENDLKVDGDEIINYAKTLIGRQYLQYNIPIPGDEVLTENAKNVLENKDEAKKIYEELYQNKVYDFIKENIKVEDKEVAHKDFVELFKDLN